MDRELRIVCHLGMGAVGGGGVPRWIVPLEPDDDTQVRILQFVSILNLI